MAKPIYTIETGVPLPEHGKRGAKRGARRYDFAAYLSEAKQGLANGSYKTAESAAYRIARDASRNDGIDFDALKSHLRYHLNSDTSAKD